MIDLKLLRAAALNADAAQESYRFLLPAMIPGELIYSLVFIVSSSIFDSHKIIIAQFWWGEQGLNLHIFCS